MHRIDDIKHAKKPLAATRARLSRCKDLVRLAIGGKWLFDGSAMRQKCDRRLVWAEWVTSTPDTETGTVTRKMVVRLAGIEPTTLGFGGQYSIH
jgi:hypothetical protein